MALQDISHVFALSGSYVEARIRFVENSTNINGNYSSVSIYIDVHRTNTGYTTNGSGSLSGWINDAYGNRVYNFSSSISSDIKVSGPSWVTFYAVTVNVSHNSIGKGNCSVGVSIDWQRDGSSSASFTMSSIPRAATISNVSNFTDEDDPSFSFSNPGNFNMECWLEPNPNGDHLAIRTLSGTSGTFKWTLTDEERVWLRKKCAGKTCTIRVGLYSNDKAFASYKDVTYSIVNGNPVLGANSWETTNHLDLVNSDTVIKGKSTVNVTVGAATPKKEATIKQYKVVIGSQIKTSETPTAFSFENVDASIINVYVEDSRGFVSSEILNISKFINYVEPDILSLSAERNDGGIGSGVILSYKGSMWSGNFGKEENTITVQYFYKKNGDSVWTQGLTDITPESISLNFENSEEILGDLGALGFEQSSVYDLKIIITDLLGSYEEIKIGGIPSGKPEMAFSGKGVAFGSFYNSEEGGPVQIEGLNIINLLHPIGSQIYNAKDDFDPNVYYPGTTWIRIKGYVLGGINEEDVSRDKGTMYDFNQPSGTQIGSKYLQQHSHQQVIIANEQGNVYRRRDYQSEGNAGIYPQNAWTMNEGIGTAQNIQPTQLTYIWERTA